MHHNRFFITIALAAMIGFSFFACGDDPVPNAYAEGTLGLDFELIDNDTAYRVRKGSVTSGIVYIPAYRLYNNEYLPVTEIGALSDGADDVSGAFQFTYISDVIFLEPVNITTIGSDAFLGCTELTSIPLPAGVLNIGDSAFGICGDSTSVAIPDSVLSIGDMAFWGNSLTSVTIPGSVTSIGMKLFHECPGLTTITVVPTNLNYASQNGILYNKAMTTLIEAPEGITGDVILPNSVTHIGMGAFMLCFGLTSVTIPDGVTHIGAGAFAACIGLTNVTIPASVTNIGGGAFMSCFGLTSVTVFAETPSLLESLPEYDDNAVFEDVHDDLRIYVPADSVDAYKAAAGWSAYASRIFAITP